MSLRVAVVGAGGVGGYLAHRLIAAGHAVAVLARGAHLAAIRERGLTLADDHSGEETLRPAAASDRGEDLGPADLAVFAVKGQDLDGAIEAARPILSDGGHALSLLNGVEGPERLAAAFGPARALAGIARISAVIEAPGRVRKVTPWASFTIGTLDGRQDRAPVPELLALLRDAGITAPDCADVRADLWRKFVGLSAFSAVTAGARADIATVLATPELRALLERLIDEALALAAARGVDLGAEAKAAQMTASEGLPGAMRASLAHDLAAGKPLEIDWLSGAVARLGAEAGLETPAHRTVAALLAPYRTGAPAG